MRANLHVSRALDIADNVGNPDWCEPTSMSVGPWVSLTTLGTQTGESQPPYQQSLGITDNIIDLSDYDNDETKFYFCSLQSTHTMKLNHFRDPVMSWISYSRCPYVILLTKCQCFCLQYSSLLHNFTSAVYSLPITMKLNHFRDPVMSWISYSRCPYVILLTKCQCFCLKYSSVIFFRLLSNTSVSILILDIQ